MAHSNRNILERIFCDNIFKFTSSKCMLLELYNSIFNARNMNNIKSGYMLVTSDVLGWNQHVNVLGTRVYPPLI